MLEQYQKSIVADQSNFSNRGETDPHYCTHLNESGHDCKLSGPGNSVGRVSGVHDGVVHSLLRGGYTVKSTETKGPGHHYTIMNHKDHGDIRITGKNHLSGQGQEIQPCDLLHACHMSSKASR